MIEWDEPHYTKAEEEQDSFEQDNQDRIGDEVAAEMIEEGKDPEGADQAEWEDRTSERLEDEWQRVLDARAEDEADRYMTYRFGYDY